MMTTPTTVTVGYLGPKHSYSHQACLELCKTVKELEGQKRIVGELEANVDVDVQVRPFPSITDVYDSSSSPSSEPQIDYIVLPLQNTIHGIVQETLRCLTRPETRPRPQSRSPSSSRHWQIVADFDLAIKHCLVVKKGVKVQDVRWVRSHEQALGQCSTYLSRYLPRAKRIPTSSTAGAATFLANHGINSRPKTNQNENHAQTQTQAQAQAQAQKNDTALNQNNDEYQNRKRDRPTSLRETIIIPSYGRRKLEDGRAISVDDSPEIPPDGIVDLVQETRTIVSSSSTRQLGESNRTHIPTQAGVEIHGSSRDGDGEEEEEEEEEQGAAICSKKILDSLPNLELIAEGVQNVKVNYTRFLLLRRNIPTTDRQQRNQEAQPGSIPARRRFFVFDSPHGFQALTAAHYRILGVHSLPRLPTQTSIEGEEEKEVEEEGGHEKYRFSFLVEAEIGKRDEETKTTEGMLLLEGDAYLGGVGQ